MKQRTLFAFCVILAVTGVVAAQSKTVTNADLEKYRQERLKNERDYRANYEMLGLSSPEELERRREQSRLETMELSAQLRAERLERERSDAERAAVERQARPVPYYAPPLVYGQFESFYPSHYSFSRGHFPRQYRRPFVQRGYYAGGTFIPTGPSTRPKPMFVQVRPRRR